jgi:hypothetical protein
MASLTISRALFQDLKSNCAETFLPLLVVVGEMIVIALPTSLVLFDFIPGLSVIKSSTDWLYVLALNLL